MMRKSLLIIAIALASGCAQMQVPGIPSLGKAKVDPNLTQIAANFKGPAAGRNAVATQTLQSIQLQNKALGVAQDGKIDAYLNAILARLQAGLPGTPPPARVYATPNTEFNARSFEDGGIFIPYKVLDALESEDELASLIAHEYAHVALQHYHSDWIDTAANLAYSAGNIYINRQLKTSTDKDLLGMVLTNDAVLGASQIGLVPALTRDQENEADQLGVDLLIRARYSIVGAITFLSRMEEWEARNQAILDQRKTNYFDLFSKSEQSVIAKAIDAQIDVLENKLAKQIHSTSQKHDKGEDRSKTLRSYIKQHYAGVDRPPLSVAPYTAALKSSHAKAFFTGLDQAHASTAALAQKNLPQALSNATGATKSPAALVPFARHVMINAMAVNGKSADALAMLESDVGTNSALFVDNVFLINILKKSSPEKALTLAQHSYERYADSPELLPDLILLSKQQKNPFAVMKYYGVCAGKAMASSNNALLESCNKAKG
ncbi:hypothetical protein DM813_08395 [Pseudomonas alkylphenolica]|uniref:Peptidase M48 domain-containing protein n=2 Tax=Pseudomonas alkylphenolica TaxID=237609 RepID=A0A443ZVR9_9PSED|nr:hypothetical protein DM813_08395 [Pseudomonas alkylphenolica]